jgi:hypothetical protein
MPRARSLVPVILASLLAACGGGEPAAVPDASVPDAGPAVVQSAAPVQAS